MRMQGCRLPAAPPPAKSTRWDAPAVPWLIPPPDVVRATDPTPLSCAVRRTPPGLVSFDPDQGLPPGLVSFDPDQDLFFRSSCSHCTALSSSRTLPQSSIYIRRVRLGPDPPAPTFLFCLSAIASPTSPPALGQINSGPPSYTESCPTTARRPPASW
jgi:hypothetical protein